MEQEIRKKKEELKIQQGNFLKTFLYKRKLASSINSLEDTILTARKDLQTKALGFLKTYQTQIDWYYWGEKGFPSFWALQELFETCNTASILERDKMLLLIQERAFQEMIQLRKQGYQLVIPNGIFNVNATFDNPLEETIKNIQFCINMPSGWKAEIEPKLFSILQRALLLQKEKCNSRPKINLPSYILELRFTFSSLPVANQVTNKTICGYLVVESEYFTSIANASNVSFTCDKTNFVKTTIISEEIRKGWLKKSAEGAFCAVMGCDNKPLDWKCPKCSFHFCADHKNHAECLM